MKTITDSADIKAAFENFISGRDGAYATNRLIPGADSPMEPQEWAEHGTVNGVPAKVYYLFSGEDCEHEEARNMPFDEDHVSMIEIADEDEDGGYEKL